MTYWDYVETEKLNILLVTWPNETSRALLCLICSSLASVALYYLEDRDALYKLYTFWLNCSGILIQGRGFWDCRLDPPCLIHETRDNEIIFHFVFTELFRAERSRHSMLLPHKLYLVEVSFPIIDCLWVHFLFTRDNFQYFQKRFKYQKCWMFAMSCLPFVTNLFITRKIL